MFLHDVVRCNWEESMIAARRLSLPLLVVLSTFSGAAAQDLANEATERRIESLLQQMTIEEKAGQLNQSGVLTPETLDLIKQGKVGSVLGVLGAARINEAQRAAAQSRLKIPLIVGFDVIHGYRTVFPVPIASAGSFDPDLIEQAERVAAKEATADGVKWTFAPMLDIARDPRWGRMVEGAGEDPYLGSLIAAAKVRGFQGRSLADPQSLVACAKHFVGYGAAEGGRDYNTAEIPEQLLREVYLPPFQAAVKAGTGTVMSAFEDLNGVPATANPGTLTGVLRGLWGFNGFVVSDYSSVHELIAHGVAKDDAEATEKALSAGVDMDMADGAYLQSIPALVQSGQLPVSILDEAVRRVLRIKFAAGLFDNAYTDPGRAKRDILTSENRQLARKLAQESLVLLKNQDDLLPLKREVKSIAVLGPLANDRANQLGSWVGNGQAQDAVTPLEGLKARLPNALLLYAKGAEIPSFEKGASPLVAAPAPATATGATGTGEASGPAKIEDAVAAAKKADVVVLFLGELGNMTGEASSRASLDFPGQQQQLLDAVVATGKPVILVLESGRPLDIRWANQHVAAIIQAWYLGVESGNAIADILVGDVGPSGRLAISWPRRIGQIPIYYNHQSTGRPTAPDRWHTGYLDESSKPLFPFGYGLSYTTFKYDGLSVTTPKIAPDGTLHVSAEVRNDGLRRGTEVVQLYLHDRVAPTSRPVRELKGFSRVTLGPGERKTVEFSVDAKDLGSLDLSMHWAVPPGSYDVWVAPNAAADGVHGTFDVTAR
jgi:beta-glucosidase